MKLVRQLKRKQKEDAQGNQKGAAASFGENSSYGNVTFQKIQCSYYGGSLRFRGIIRRARVLSWLADQ